MKIFVKRFCITLFLVLVLCVAGIKLRVHYFLQPVEMPILRYENVAEKSFAADVVTDYDFYFQVRDLLEQGYSCISLKELRRYKGWGISLPPNPFLVTVRTTDRTVSQGVIDALKDQEVTAVLLVDKAPKKGEAEPAPEDETRLSLTAALESGCFELLEEENGDIGFSEENGIATVSARCDWRALPALRINGGSNAYSIELHRDSLVPENFGTLNIAHKEGPAFPLVLLVYRPDDDAPFIREELPPLQHSDTFKVSVPKDVEFPLEVGLYDFSKTVCHFRVFLRRNAVIRAPGYRVPLSVTAPDLTSPELMTPELSTEDFIKNLEK